MNKYENLSKHILEYIGGKDNVVSYTNCVTRLRIVTKDRSIIDIEQIQKLKGVLGTQFVGEQLQIIIGQDVVNVANAFGEVLGKNSNDLIKNDVDKPKKKVYS
ncbi:PTS glucose/sucrose transporter subunit IIB [Virgibacillus halophilus]|uniref:PTS glucose/sucrose transporter subunit IIB n=1 Tax=Tigheibacillus halophilus TaxID=361280 RepID=A0ABU5C7J8_9BACI|nr:PTS glucose/sucrose transporter subunit IIB [Virgibacillus halophilus]